MVRQPFLKTIVFCAAVFLLSACQSDEERAEEHFQNAMALLAEGDTARAAVEFRNVFQNNGFHEEARANYAAMLRASGNVEQSYSQYLRLVEQYPDHIEGRAALAEMALAFQNWDEADRHGRRLLELAPEHPSAPVISVYLDYLDAAEAEDEPARRNAFDRATALLAGEPDNAALQLLVIDGLIQDGALEEALVVIERALRNDPDNRSLHDGRLQVLAQLDRPEEAEAALREMVTVFPDDEELPGTLLRFLVARGEVDAAVGFLRERAAAANTPQDRDDALMALVQLRFQSEGAEGANAELDAIVEATDEQAVVFRVLRASLRFDAGETEEAISDLEALRAQELATIDRSRLEVALAQMYLATGDRERARALVEGVLEADPSQVDALKMQAAWLIEEDEADLAISRLRTALDARPDDAEALTLMADAHFRAGNRQLARDFLSLAVEASGSAPGETLRYVRVLIDDERYLVAEELVVEALRQAPGEPDLLTALGEIYLRLEDWPRAEQVERTLRASDTPDGILRADRLRTAIFGARGQAEEALAFLEGLAAESTEDLRAQIAVIQARVAIGDSARALSFTDDLLAEDPGNVPLRLTRAAVLGASGRHAEAEEVYRALIAEDPEFQAAWIGLLRALGAQGRREEVETALAEALEALPSAPDLLWAQASYFERQGDFEGAIEIYQRLYGMAPNSTVIANNLASLISTYREDQESLDQAYTIARRLRGSDTPQFQDTYGWIVYRRGDYEEALAHLEPAATALQGNPLVQYHLGMTYAALGRGEEALEFLRLALRLAGPDDPRPQFQIARDRIASIEADARSPENDTAGDGD
jgi:tetratricopeptide (TPR) repeat protein